MMMKKMICFALAAACVATVSAQSSRRSFRNGRGGAQAEAEAEQDKMDAKVKISQMRSIGPQSLIMAPALSAQGGLQPISKGRRQWGVYDMTYRTAQRWTEELTVNWYVLCDTAKAKTKDKSRTAKRLPPYVYYTLVTRYVNIPEGDHRSCACLPPSFIERYGEPVVISCEIVTSAGKLLDGETVVNSFPWVKPGKFTEETKNEMEWWNIDKIINAKDNKTGEAMIEVRQGLVDRSKTPFWLVNNADYEAIQ
jgi:hypothetical protein